MRIISGSRRGYRLKAPSGIHTRPTTDRVKESVFNMIQLHLPAGLVLDLFSGSGAMGIEALSRGSLKAVFVDNDREAAALTKENLAGSQLAGQAQVVQGDALAYLARCTEAFDLIFLDPPYNQGLVSAVLDRIYQNKLLKQDGLIVLETEADGERVEGAQFQILKSVKYGKTVISLLQG